jgi:hypothetical protein
MKRHIADDRAARVGLSQVGGFKKRHEQP